MFQVPNTFDISRIINNELYANENLMFVKTI